MPLATKDRKQCSKCRKLRHLADFNKNRWVADGFQNQCRECQRAPAQADRRAPSKSLARNGEKVCSKCHEKLPQTAFGKHKTRPDGLQHRCRDCRNTAHKLRAAGLSETERATQRVAQCEVSKRYRLSHPEAAKAAYQKWCHENPERLRDYTKQRRTARRKAPGRGVTPKVWEQIVEGWQGLCAYCFADAVAVDHIISIQSGGAHDPLNVVPCCKSCNSAKGARMLENWEPGRGLDIARVHEIAGQVKRDPRGKFRGEYSLPPTGSFPEVPVSE